jgi:hypothetical protein
MPLDSFSALLPTPTSASWLQMLAIEESRAPILSILLRRRGYLGGAHRLASRIPGQS